MYCCSCVLVVTWIWSYWSATYVLRRNDYPWSKGTNWEKYNKTVCIFQLGWQRVNNIITISHHNTFLSRKFSEPLSCLALFEFPLNFPDRYLFVTSTFLISRCKTIRHLNNNKIWVGNNQAMKLTWMCDVSFTPFWWKSKRVKITYQDNKGAARDRTASSSITKTQKKF